MKTITYTIKVKIFKQFSIITTAVIFLIVLVNLSIGFIKQANPMIFEMLSKASALSFSAQSTYVSGITQKNVKYLFQASNLNTNLVDFLSTKQTDFNNPNLQIYLPNNRKLDIFAENATINTNNKEIYLYNDVKISNNNEYNLFLQDLLFSFNTASMLSNNPFTMTLKDYTITGLTLESISSRILKATFVNVVNNVSNFTAHSNYIEVNDIYSQITLKDNVSIVSDDYSLMANILTAKYKNVKNFQFDSIQDFTRISAQDNVNISLRLSDPNNAVNMLGDEFIYDVLKDIMILRSLNKDKLVTFTNSSYVASATHRMEYQPNKHLVIMRGSPKIQYLEYTVNAGLISINLTINNRINYSELFDDVVITKDDAVIKADYGIFDNANNIISLEDNIEISNNEGVTTGCKLIINLLSGDIKLITCNDESNTLKINNPREN